MKSASPLPEMCIRDRIHAGLVVDGVADCHAERDIGTVQLIVLLRHFLLAGRADLQMCIRDRPIRRFLYPSYIHIV